MQYYPRIVDSVLPERLEASGALLIEGLKWCGKTTTAEQIAASSLSLHNPSTRARNLELAAIDASRLLAGETPRLIDEWQDAPQLWDAVRFEVDRRAAVGQFILTGSSVPPRAQQVAHSGTGRISRVRMRTMSLRESFDSTGGVSLASLFAGGTLPEAESDINIERLAFLICRGGWPGALRLKEKAALRQAYDYLDAVVESDLIRIDGVARDPDRGRALLRSYARLVSSQASFSVIRKDLAGSQSPLGESALSEYVGVLKRMFVLDDRAAWNPNLRSKAAIRTSPTRHFGDPSIAAAALGASPTTLLSDLETFGLLFEDLAIRDLRIYAEALDGTVRHYRDSDGLECDGVIILRDGRYGLVEIKLGGEKLINQGAESLNKLRAKLDTARMGHASFSMILTGVGDMAYERTDGIIVVPIGCLAN